MGKDYDTAAASDTRDTPRDTMRAAMRSGARVEVIEVASGRRHFVTNRQLTILLSLANGSRTAATVAYDWPGMTGDMARSLLSALYRKGLVEPDRFEHQGRTWGLSRRGGAFVDALERVGWDDVDGDAVA